jgi:hypothetical protein
MGNLYLAKSKKEPPIKNNTKTARARNLGKY